MSRGRNLSVNGRQNSLNSIYSSSESLSSSHGVDSWCRIDQELVPMSTSYAIPWSMRIKASNYDTCAVEYNDEMKHNKKGGSRVRKAFSFNRSSKLKKTASIDKETPPHMPDAAELMARLSLLEEQVRTMGKELHKERLHREELQQKVENLQSENDQLKSQRKHAGDQLQKFCKNFFDSINSVSPHLMHNGISASSLNKSALSMRRSGTSINSMTSQ